MELGSVPIREPCIPPHPGSPLGSSPPVNKGNSPWNIAITSPTFSFGSPFVGSLNPHALDSALFFLVCSGVTRLHFTNTNFRKARWDISSQDNSSSRRSLINQRVHLKTPCRSINLGIPIQDKSKQLHRPYIDILRRILLSGMLHRYTESYIIFLNVCMYVCYRFSRQPLTRLFWNFAWCFEIISERQLSILVSIGGIITELWHN